MFLKKRPDTEKPERYEIHALPYAVCRFVSWLDDVFKDVVPNWLPLHAGITLEVHGRRPNDTHVWAKVFPVNWPHGSELRLWLDRWGAGEPEWWKPLGWQIIGCTLEATFLHLWLRFDFRFGDPASIRLIDVHPDPKVATRSKEFFEEATRELREEFFRRDPESAAMWHSPKRALQSAHGRRGH